MREEDIRVLMADGNTRNQAEKFLNAGTVVYDDLKENFEKYASEREEAGWGEEEIEAMKAMVFDESAPIMGDWGVVKEGGKTYFIEYAL